MVRLPMVQEDGSLVFDPMGPVPESVPMFVRNGNRFYPIFCPCKHRTTVEKAVPG